MQDVNNDMDDLFRKAAEHYPLQTGSANWDKVLAGLQDNDDAPAPVATGARQKRNRRALWLLWLLPLCLLYMPLHNRYRAKNEAVNTKTLASKKDTVAVNTSKIKTATQRSDKELNNNANLISDNAKSDRINRTHSLQSFDENGTKMPDHTNADLVKKTRAKQQDAAIIAPGNNKETSANETANNSNSKTKDRNEPTLKNNSIEKQPDEVTARIEKVTTEEESKKIDVQKEAIAKDTANIVNKDSAATKSNTKNDANKKLKKLQTQWQKGFYGGLAGSFDISTVKLQRVNKTGYGLQVLAGYRFSKHISAETGLGWEIKNYYSTGKYFDKKKTNIPDPVEIYFSNGNCKMLEIPLSLKYDFAVGKKSSWFATVGLSSYFMKKENYFYHGNYRTNNMNWIYDTTRYYRNSGNNLLSVADFSIGYQLQLNKHSAVRIEPYIKLPLHGIGIANMPITSTGISVGFTRKF